MANFRDMAMAIAKKNMLVSKEKVDELKSRKELANSLFDRQIAEESVGVAQSKMAMNEMVAEEKNNKIKSDLIKKGMGNQGGNIAVGGNLVDRLAGFQVSGDAQGLPIVGA